MNYPGSTQLGLGKKLLEQFPWWQFESHQEWADLTCFAAGIPGEVRIIYLPRRNIYNWSGPEVRNLDQGVWKAYYFDPATGRKFEQGTIEVSEGPYKKSEKSIDFQQNVPSPQDWVLVLEKVSA